MDETVVVADTTDRCPVIHEAAPPTFAASLQRATMRHEPTEMCPGDRLSIPACIEHSAATTTSPSFHLTIGIHAVSKRAIVHAALQSLDALDAPLPLGFGGADDEAAASLVAGALAEAQRWLSDFDPTSLPVTDLGPRRRRRGTDQLLHAFDAATVDVDSEVRLRAGVDAVVTAGAAGVAVAFAGRTIRLPAAARPALEQLVARDRTRIGDLADLDPVSQVVVARRLVEEGLLAVEERRPTVAEPLDHSPGVMRRSARRHSIGAEEVPMPDTDTDQLGPIDYTVIEFPGSQFNGKVIPALNDLIAAGLVRILDVAFVAKDEDGNVVMAELEELGDLGPLAGLAGFLSDLVSEEDLMEVAAEMEPGNSAALLIWENRWAVPFIEAVRGSGGDFVASGRLAGAAVLEALSEDGMTD